MNIAELKEEILALITALKLTEKEIISMEIEADKWKGRVELARSQGMDGLTKEAEREADRIIIKLTGFREEERSLKEQIEAKRRQLSYIAAMERSIDADLLEQELLMALGRSEETETDKTFRKLEEDINSEAALEALKAKMKGNNANGEPV